GIVVASDGSAAGEHGGASLFDLRLVRRIFLKLAARCYVLRVVLGAAPDDRDLLVVGVDAAREVVLDRTGEGVWKRRRHLPGGGADHDDVRVDSNDAVILLRNGLAHGIKL